MSKKQGDFPSLPKFLIITFPIIFGFVILFMLAMYYLDHRIKADECAELCTAHEGTMLTANGYGCTCKIDGWVETFRSEGLLD